MKRILLIFMLSVITLIGAGSFKLVNKPGKLAPPNFIFILTDDQGWSSTSIGMDDRIRESKSDYYETPNIDRLGREGIRFTNAYAPAAICSPSRRSILFGQTPARQGDEIFSKNYQPYSKEQKITIPLLLKAIDPGYKTAHFGKWDLRAEIFPEDLGYDESDGDTRNSHGNLMTNKEDKWEGLFINDDPKRSSSITGRAMNFMQRQVREGNPFYLQISHYAPHVDIQTKQTTLDKYRNKAKGVKHNNPGWAGMLEDMDRTVGDIMEKVEQLGIAENTYIIFMADNGGVEFLPPVPSKRKMLHPDTFDKPMRNFPLRGGKWTLYEGGIRVPFMVKGPGIAPGKMSHESVGGWDILPTIGELAGYSQPLPEDLDGGSFAGIVQSGGKGKVSRNKDYLVFHRYSKAYPHSALIQGNYKVIRFWKTGKLELYNLASDFGELKDLYGTDTSKANELDFQMKAYIKEVNPGLLEELLAY
ncbi:sulfatase [uncultured Cyclobacterium sp.]|uniref:sulfatase n=1 Tax=uncultured Cyclobacterium sp. TaxID=453820 RepID=UPI0030EE4B41|tara:strand:+ start:11051 stop:12469 length:1419 start_codon:yes stop_codon:yes gene_type:complete